MTAIGTGSPGPRTLIAPLSHTVGLILIQVAIALGGAYMLQRSPVGPDLPSQPGTMVPLYLSLIVMEWALVRYVWAGVRKRGGNVFALIGGRWHSWRDALSDLAVAVPFWVVWEAAARLMHFIVGSSSSASVTDLLPQRATEILFWCGLSVSAGVCEEIVFRGYLQQQFHALTGSATAAVLFQAVLFGAGHAYQGTRQVIIITALGGLYGALAAWRGTLRPGMIAHAWSDINSGYLRLV